MTAYTVSIFMLTYNQEAFIGQTIESVLMQKTNFTYQLVLGEDYSTDKTREICEHYAKKFPDTIKLLPSLGYNQGLIANYMRTVAACNGTYIAICDGDDYWTDAFKLQKQVDFLEANPDFSIVATNYELLHPNGDVEQVKKLRNKMEFTFEDLVYDNLITSATVLFRNYLEFDPLPQWILQFPYGDWPTYLWILRNGGKLYFLQDYTAMYRLGIGVSSPIIATSSSLLEVNIGILECMVQDHSFAPHQNSIVKSLRRLKVNRMTSYNMEGKFRKGFICFLKNILQLKSNWHVVKMYFYSLNKRWSKQY
ncbi:glycosyl transferase [Flavobacterium sp. SOK18b]|uniref:glycosyltransferase n=1 Tax=Flavobacterium sp. SOK18b TaxID=797900 RepID=UPI0015F91821|nr:glycosyltransferase [Flavobacterium sp. SOK18b]MBB1192511.1 glycosyl transferase [Flavobacterium sp. SOK18b]